MTRALGQAIAVAIHLKDADVVGQAVEECACEALGPEVLISTRN